MKLLIIHNFYVIDGGENKRVHEDIWPRSGGKTKVAA